MARIITIPCVTLLLVLATRVEATNPFFRDMEGRSESGRYVVVAKSPDNRQEGGRRGFQANFVYTCTDKRSGKILWTRKQLMEEPRQVGNGVGQAHAFPAKGSPVGIHVLDSGHTVIYTGWQEPGIRDRDG